MWVGKGAEQVAEAQGITDTETKLPGYDVVAVSIFGRGNWLAAELQRQGLKVALVDLSREMGRWTPEDWEGPVGLFRSEALTGSQLARLLEDDFHNEVENGFTVWPPGGPLELRGPISSFLLDKWKVPSILRTYLENYDSLSESEAESLRSHLNELGFEQAWLGHLAHQLASNSFCGNAYGLNHGTPLSLFSAHSIRRVSRKGVEDSLKWCESLGVDVYRNSSILDLSMVKNELHSAEVVGGWSGVVKGSKWIWSLSSEETYRLPEFTSKKLFPYGYLESQWCWMRFRVDLGTGNVADALPDKFVVIGNLSLPWAHSNLVILQRTLSKGHFDFWIRIPTQSRFQKEYIEKFYNEVVEMLRERLPGVSMVNVEMPQDYLYNYLELGPPRFPLYDLRELQSFRKRLLSNLFFDGPECGTNLDWVGQFRVQNRILGEIIEWWSGLQNQILEEGGEAQV